jgi:hypothetical protein
MQPKFHGRIRINWVDVNGLLKPMFRVLKKSRGGKWYARVVDYPMVVRTLMKKGIFKETYHLTVEIARLAVELCKTRESLTYRWSLIRQGVALSAGHAMKKVDAIELRLLG